MRKIVLPGPLLERLYVSEEKPLRQVAGELGHYVKTLLNSFRVAGLKRRSLREAWRLRKKAVLALAPSVSSAYLSGESTASLAKRFHMSKPTVKTLLVSTGVRLRNRSESLTGKPKSQAHRLRISASRRVLFIQKPEMRANLRFHRLRQTLPVRDTLPERLVEAELARREIGHYKHLAVEGVCQPDKCFPDVKLAVFCDGDYWHRRTDVREKDERVNRLLRAKGWRVLRFWEHEIKSDSKRVVDVIERELSRLRWFD